MKRYIRKGILLLLCCAILTGCGKITMPFITTTELTVEENTYEIYTYTKNGITYEVEKGLFSRDEMSSLIKNMEEELETAAQYLAPEREKEFTVRMLKKTPENGMYIENDVLYLRGNDVEKKKYIPWLIQLYYDLDQTWVAFGIYENAFVSGDEEKVDLGTYFTESDDLSMLGFFPGRFVTYLNYESNYDLVTETARQLTAYCVEQGKTKELLSGKISAQDKQAWLNSIGVNRVYDEVGEELFSKVLKFTSGTDKLFIQLEEGSYTLKRMDFMEDALRMEQYILESKRGELEAVKLLKEYCNVEAKVPVIDYIVDDELRSSSMEQNEDTSGYTIKRAQAVYPSALSMDSVFMETGVEFINWKTDLLTTYWTNAVMEGIEMGAANYYYYWIRHQFDGNPQDTIWDEYMVIDSQYAVRKEVDVRIVADILAIKAEGHPIYRYLNITEKEASPMERCDYNARESIMYYIGDTYGNEVVAEFLLGGADLKDITDATESQIIDSWKKYIKKQATEWRMDN